MSRGELLEMSFDILAVLAKKCSEGKGLIIDPDWGYGSGTLFDPITGVHTHFGDDNGEDEEKQLASFIEGLYNILLFGVPNA